MNSKTGTWRISVIGAVLGAIVALASAGKAQTAPAAPPSDPSQITTPSAQATPAQPATPPPAAQSTTPTPAPAEPPTPPRNSRDSERAQRDAERVQREAARAQERAQREAERSSQRIYFFGTGPYLGITVQDVTSDRAKALKLNEERGAEITMVDNDSPAGKAGIKENDVVLSFNGERVDSAEQLKRMIHELPPGRTVSLGLSREGKPVTISAKLADRRELAKSIRIAPMPRVVIPPMPPIEMPNIQVFTTQTSVRTGLSVESLTPQLGEYFGVPNGHGLLVRSVEKGSAAEAAGIKAGDVIVRVGNERVNDSGDWRMSMRDQTGAVPVTIVRDKREQTVTMKIPERTRGAVQGRVLDLGDIDFDFDFDQLATITPRIDETMKRAAEAMEKAGKDFEQSMRDWQDDDIQKNDKGKQKDEKKLELKKSPATTTSPEKRKNTA